MLAPLLVASTLTLFGSGVALIAVGHGGGLPLSMHAVSFVVWGVVMIVHVLAYIARTLRLGLADLLLHAEQVVAGVRSRRAALAGALLAGKHPAPRSTRMQKARINGAFAVAGAGFEPATSGL
jgi:hypothetical protein